MANTPVAYRGTGKRKTSVARVVLVPGSGQVTVNGRESAARQQRFTLRTKRYVLTGRISGTLAKPKVTGKLKVLSGVCSGEVLPFTAKLAG